MNYEKLFKNLCMYIYIYVSILTFFLYLYIEINIIINRHIYLLSDVISNMILSLRNPVPAPRKTDHSLSVFPQAWVDTILKCSH